MELRGHSISYASFKNKQRTNLEKNLINTITYLENDLNETNFGELDVLKTDLQDIRQEKLKGNLIRSRAEYIDKGERPTKDFCGLEKHNYISKTIQSLQKDGGTVRIGQDAKLKETKQFYKNLYSSSDSELEDIYLNEYVGQTMKTITDDQADRLEGLFK